MSGIDKKNTKENIAQRLKAIRERNGYRQEDIADVLGLQRSTFAYRENSGNYTPDELKVLAEFYSLSLDELLELPKKTPLAIKETPATMVVFGDSENNHIDLSLKIEKYITNTETKLLALYRSLKNREQKDKVLQFIEDLKNSEE